MFVKSCINAKYYDSSLLMLALQNVSVLSERRWGYKTLVEYYSLISLPFLMKLLEICLVISKLNGFTITRE